MQVCNTRAELAAALAKLTGTRGLVMTMGALHAGHMALVRASQAQMDHTVATVYVNPLQFAPGEDFDTYPRTPEADFALLADAGVAVVFAPTDAEMYPRPPLVRIDPGPVADILEGASRPGHFAGVLQVVHKVFRLTQPDVAFFGQRDAQQLALVRTMVADLEMGIEIAAVPIVRDPNGLALSSRNKYLTGTELVRAAGIYDALTDARDVALTGASASKIAYAAFNALSARPGIKIDYVELVHPETFQKLVGDYTGPGLLTAAAWVGDTRLIDNLTVQIG
ncbi:MAG: pantoate--beta-alanine ligase [Trueperella sp.]|nr:pantoate--beta-alanine ligase [Trueperella sp.]